ncbi:hypothetical protein D3C84_1277130 [compost metagenome]
MAHNGRQKVDTAFTFNHVADRYNNVYMEVYNSEPTQVPAATLSRYRRQRRHAAKAGKRTGQTTKRIMARGR